MGGSCTAGRRRRRSGWVRMTKYRAIPSEVEGIRFASRMEARRYRELRLMEAAGEIKDLELQKRWPLVVNGKKVCTYVSDFEYTETMTGRRITEDVKGARTAVYKLKRALMQAVHGITIRETQA
jgi:hypothetical protein